MVELVYYLVYAGVLTSGMEAIVRIVRTRCTLICHSFSEVSVHIYHGTQCTYHSAANGNVPFSSGYHVFIY